MASGEVRLMASEKMRLITSRGKVRLMASGEVPLPRGRWLGKGWLQREMLLARSRINNFGGGEIDGSVRGGGESEIDSFEVNEINGFRWVR